MRGPDSPVRDARYRKAFVRSPVDAIRWLNDFVAFTTNAATAAGARVADPGSFFTSQGPRGDYADAPERAFSGGGRVGRLDGGATAAGGRGAPMSDARGQAGCDAEFSELCREQEIFAIQRAVLSEGRDLQIHLSPPSLVPRHLERLRSTTEVGRLTDDPVGTRAGDDGERAQCDGPSPTALDDRIRNGRLFQSVMLDAQAPRSPPGCLVRRRP